MIQHVTNWHESLLISLFLVVTENRQSMRIEERREPINFRWTIECDAREETAIRFSILAMVESSLFTER